MVKLGTNYCGRKLIFFISFGIIYYCIYLDNSLEFKLCLWE